MKLDKALSAMLVFLILAAIGALAYTVAVPKAGERFTDFYVLGPEGKAEDYPEKLMVGEQGEVILGVVNQEHEESSYHIEVRLNGEAIDVMVNGEAMQEIGPVSLADKEKWEEKVTFVATKAGDQQKVEFLLYKGEDSEPYRELYLWLDVETAK